MVYVTISTMLTINELKWQVSSIARADSRFSSPVFPIFNPFSQHRTTGSYNGYLASIVIPLPMILYRATNYTYLRICILYINVTCKHPRKV